MDTLSCKLSAPELRKRKEAIISQLKTLVLEKQALPHGYKYRFHYTDATLDIVTSFIKSERTCCSFFNFTLQINNDQTIWLELSGPEGAKAFIQSELEM